MSGLMYRKILDDAVAIAVIGTTSTRKLFRSLDAKLRIPDTFNFIHSNLTHFRQLYQRILLALSLILPGCFTIPDPQKRRIPTHVVDLFCTLQVCPETGLLAPRPYVILCADILFPAHHNLLDLITLLTSRSTHSFCWHSRTAVSTKSLHQGRSLPIPDPSGEGHSSERRWHIPAFLAAP